ncbi:hypothetical protein [Mesorhizobium sp. B2-4-1]|uniref:hypothetical protein n=1 Tax=Mesorhizobium sp. B2-4-1 TaxID=2589948 RepID=UPI00112E46D0|nr:hypothetical protein [Mesorhizobium sp. B2-4-1]TPL64667.1 hypothetical protein FJ949_15450 [Mesorhizobium sp. B2-4-1]
MTSTNLTTANRKDLNAQTARFEHRHFATIAKIIRDMPARGGDQLNIARHFARELCGTNPRFQANRFLAACGVED